MVRIRPEKQSGHTPTRLLTGVGAVGLMVMLLLLVHCDTDRLWGSRFEAFPLTRSIVIQGTVMDRFQEKPVRGATVRVGDQEALTNFYGEYRLEFYLSTSFDRNKPVDIEVSAENYISFRDRVILDPIDQEMNFQLDYGAPIIGDAVRHVFDNGIAVVQVRLLDYQNDVTEVVLELEYKSDDTPLTISYPMYWIASGDNGIQLFQREAPIYVSRDFKQYTITATFWIVARDDMGFVTRKEFVQPLDQNRALFLPYTPNDNTQNPTNGFDSPKM